MRNKLGKEIIRLITLMFNLLQPFSHEKLLCRPYSSGKSMLYYQLWFEDKLWESLTGQDVDISVLLFILLLRGSIT